MIYLPPAALSDRPPALPVMELLAGQPGSPSRLIDAGNIAATMNAYAAKHDGLAPIVLVPDQNGEATHNSLSANNATETTASLLWTGNAIDLVELIYGIDEMGCINNGNMPLKQLAPILYKRFGIESKDCYRFYTDIKRRKNESRTYFLDKMQEKLNERMLRDEELERMRR
jgi:hypothetical protein